MITNDNRQNAHSMIDHIFHDLLPVRGMAERPEQVTLSHLMLDAMLDSSIALCDAGTGIGKTYAYLAAGAAFHCFRANRDRFTKPILISTSSIALQNAIQTEYLPSLLSKTTRQQLRKLSSTMELFTRENDGLVFYAMEDRWGGTMLCAVATDMTAQLRSTLWNQERPVILTSGMLSTTTSGPVWRSWAGFTAQAGASPGHGSGNFLGGLDFTKTGRSGGSSPFFSLKALWHLHRRKKEN